MDYFIWVLEESEITVSGGGQLDGVTQGDGSHLDGRTITLNSASWRQVFVRDDDTFFDDNDTSNSGGQALDGAQTIDGVTYADGTKIEAEYRFTVQYGTDIYELIAVNVSNSNPSYGTIEALAFIGPEGGFPPRGVELEVIETGEGPQGSNRTDASTYAEPICFTPGTRITTALGPRPVEEIRPGDLIATLDHGLQPVRWVGRRRLAALPACSPFQPVRIAAGALGAGLPRRDLLVSPQHRLLVGGPRVELLAEVPSVLVAAKRLVGRPGVTRVEVEEVTYLHLLFDRHEVICAEGVAAEALHPGARAMSSLDRTARAEVLALFPDLARVATRPCARPEAGREAALLVA